MVTMGDENVAPSNIPRLNARADPMAMLLAAKREHTESQDKVLAEKVAERLEREHQRDAEQHKVAMMVQSEEDEAALRAAEQEAEDRRLAQQTQMQEEKAALEEQSQLKAQLTEDEKLAMSLQQELAKKLYDAIKKTDAMTVHGLLKQGMDPSIILSSSDAKQSALQCAVLKRNVEIVRLLADTKGIELDYKDVNGNTAMHFAAEANRVDIMTILLGAGAKPDIKNLQRTSPLMFAARNGYFEPIELLIKKGADLYYKDKQNKMAVHLVPMLSRSLKRKLEGMMGWGLLEAARKGRGDDVMSLIARGASVLLSDDKNMTALHHAAANGHNIVVQYLLDKKANPNKKDVKGETPLHKAAQFGSGAVWTTLLRGGANPQIKDFKGLIAEEHCNKAVPLSQMLLPSRKRPTSAKPAKAPLQPSAAANKGQAPTPAFCPAEKPQQEAAAATRSDDLETHASDTPAHAEAAEEAAAPAQAADGASTEAPDEASPSTSESEAEAGAPAEVQAEEEHEIVQVQDDSDDSDDDEDEDFEAAARAQGGASAEPTVISSRPSSQLSTEALPRSDSAGGRKPHHLPPLKVAEGDLMPTTSFSTRSSAATTPASAQL